MSAYTPDKFVPGECRGDDTCSAPRHVHGCYTPHRADQCDAPNEHEHLPDTRPDLDALQARASSAIRGLRQQEATTKDGLVFNISGNAGDLIRDLAAALAAERERSDRAESKVTSALEIAAVWIDSESSEPAPISVVTAGRVFHGLLTSEATA